MILILCEIIMKDIILNILKNLFIDKYLKIILILYTIFNK
jgi:hypothetical protein